MLDLFSAASTLSFLTLRTCRFPFSHTKPTTILHAFLFSPSSAWYGMFVLITFNQSKFYLYLKAVHKQPKPLLEIILAHLQTTLPLFPNIQTDLELRRTFSVYFSFCLFCKNPRLEMFISLSMYLARLCSPEDRSFIFPFLSPSQHPSLPLNQPTFLPFFLCLSLFLPNFPFNY